MTFIINPYRFASSGGLVSDPDVLLLLSARNGSIEDLSSYQHSITVNGTPAVSSDFAKFGTQSIKIMDDSESVNTNYLGIPDVQASAGTLTSITIEAWILYDDPLIGFFQSWLGATSTPTTNGAFQVGKNNSNGYMAYIYDAGYKSFPASGGAVPTNTWIYHAITWDGTTYRSYVNGVLNGSVASTRAPANLCNIGRGGGGGGDNRSWRGHVDEVRITQNVVRDVTVVPTDRFPLT